jgi:predicted ester cyclase
MRQAPAATPQSHRSAASRALRIQAAIRPHKTSGFSQMQKTTRPQAPSSRFKIPLCQAIRIFSAMFACDAARGFA